MGDKKLKGGIGSMFFNRTKLCVLSGQCGLTTKPQSYLTGRKNKTTLWAIADAMLALSTLIKFIVWADAFLGK